MKNENFIKFIKDSEESDFLQKHHPNAFLLLCHVAKRARRYSGDPDGLKIGEAFIGDYKDAGIESEMKYRTAKKILIQRQHLLFIESCRTRKKATTGTTTKGTKVKLLKSGVWDINEETDNDLRNERVTTEQRPDNDEQEVKEVKEDKNKTDVVVNAREEVQKKEEKIERIFTKSDMYRLALMQKRDWSSAEMEEAWPSFEKAKNIRVPMNYIDTIIHSNRHAKMENERLCLINQKTNTKTEKNENLSSQTSKEESLEIGTPNPLFTQYLSAMMKQRGY